MVSPNDSSKSIVFFTDDDDNTRPLINTLSSEDFSVHVFSRRNTIIDPYFIKDTDMLVIESNHFSFEELALFAKIKNSYAGLLVLLSNEIDELLQVMIYEQGIDDLLIKPVNPLLMLAHIRALFRRNCRRGLTANLDFNGLKINGSTRQASYRGEDIPLSSREFDLLWYLAQNACMTLDRDRLYKNVFGVEYNGYDRSIDMYISRLRTKLSESTGLPPVIKTVRGKGYLFVVED